MKMNKLIIFVALSVLQCVPLCPTIAQDNPYKFKLKKDIKEHLWTYLYHIGIESSPVPPVMDIAENDSVDCIYADSSYMFIQNMINGKVVSDNADLDYCGIYSFYPLYYSHIDTYVFLKAGNECEVIYSGECGFVYATEDLSIQMKQLLEYFDAHDDVDARLLAMYIQCICSVYENNTKYIEDDGLWDKWYNCDMYKYVIPK